MGRWILVLLVCAAGWGGVAARADAATQFQMPPYSSNPVIGMQCDEYHNRLLIRFGSTLLTSDNDTPGELITDGDFIPIPQSLITGWNNSPIHLGGNCNFANGQKITAIMTGEGEAGYGGVYFELTVNGRIVYYNIKFGFFDAGATTSPQKNQDFVLAAVSYDGRKLLQCLPGDGQDASSGPAKNVKCSDVSYRLASNYHFIDPDELAYWNQQQAKARLAKALTPFCKLLGERDTGSIIVGNTVLLPNSVSVSGDSYLSVGEFSANIDNRGTAVPVVDVNFGPDDHVGYDVLFAFSKNPSIAARFIAQIKRLSINQADGGVINPTPAERGASIQIGKEITGNEDYWESGGTGLSNDHALFEFHGTIYISSGFEGYFDEPSRIIQEVLPDDSIKTVCEFP